MKRRRREQGGDDVETHNTTLEIVTAHAGRDEMDMRKSKNPFSYKISSRFLRLEKI